MRDAEKCQHCGEQTTDPPAAFCCVAAAIDDHVANETLRLKRRVEELEAALTEACTCMEGLADQQAMDDDWYVEPLARCRKLLSPQEKP
jgi:hypothetical protein